MAYPTTLDAKIPWHSTFNQECIDRAATFAAILDAPTLAAVLANKNFVATLINGSDVAKNFGQEVIAFRDNYLGAPLGTPPPAIPVPPVALTVPLGAVVGIDAFTRALIAQLNAHPAMTDAIRAAMGIMPASRTLGTVRISSGTALADSQVLLRLVLAGYPAVAVYRKRNNETERIGISITSTFTDTDGPLVAGQSESREYWIRGIVDNVEQGDLSARVLVATTP